MAFAGTRNTDLPPAKTLLAGTALVVFLMLSPQIANTQEITGKPGAPGTTTTIDGRYIRLRRRHSPAISNRTRRSRRGRGRRWWFRPRARPTSFSS
jgi:hypothetical protein